MEQKPYPESPRVEGERREKKKKKKNKIKIKKNKIKEKTKINDDEQPKHPTSCSLTTQKLERTHDPSHSRSNSIHPNSVGPHAIVSIVQTNKSKRKLEEHPIDQERTHEIRPVRKIKRRKIKEKSFKSPALVDDDSLDGNSPQITPIIAPQASHPTVSLSIINPSPVSPVNKPSKKSKRRKKLSSSSSSTADRDARLSSSQPRFTQKDSSQESQKHDVPNPTRAKEDSHQQRAHQPTIKSRKSTSSGTKPSSSSSASTTSLDKPTTVTQDSVRHQRSPSSSPSEKRHKKHGSLALSLDKTLIDHQNCHLFKPESRLNTTRQARLLNLTGRQILCSIWLNISQLNELSDLFGLKFKKGRFTAAEQEIIESTIKRFCQKNCLASTDFVHLSRTRKRRDEMTQGLIAMICEKLDGRPLMSVWQFIRRAYNLRSRAGKWTEEEEEALQEAYNKHGSHWTLVSQAVGRSADDCKDRWRNHTCVKGIRRSGEWSKEEEDQLIDLMNRSKSSGLVGKLKDTECEGLWTWVSEQMGGLRSRAQCRAKWVESLRPRLQNGNRTPIWKHRDILILAQQLQKYNFQDETGFDWRQLGFEGWSVWSQHSLQRRWQKIKKHFLKKKMKSMKAAGKKDDELMTGDLAVEIKTEEILDDIIERYRSESDKFLDSPVRFTSHLVLQPEVIDVDDDD